MKKQWLKVTFSDKSIVIGYIDKKHYNDDAKDYIKRGRIDYVIQRIFDNRNIEKDSPLSYMWVWNKEHCSERYEFITENEALAWCI